MKKILKEISLELPEDGIFGILGMFEAQFAYKHWGPFWVIRAFLALQSEIFTQKYDFMRVDTQRRRVWQNFEQEVELPRSF